ncbi:hypothetical protein BSZ19_19820 [Bradyrhizobium japonicum]|uniref:Uncharacterized protein n=1 Tax=Bradyrhizobium japonicum TaxID=375 RepID=A0A1Y2JMQ8_BRAJP|nr:hypothetical protein BSZ19_19820 [Bradyrhizobium japonicum]
MRQTCLGGLRSPLRRQRQKFPFALEFDGGDRDPGVCGPSVGGLQGPPDLGLAARYRFGTFFRIQ